MLRVNSVKNKGRFFFKTEARHPPTPTPLYILVGSGKATGHKGLFVWPLLCEDPLRDWSEYVARWEQVKGPQV